MAGGNTSTAIVLLVVIGEELVGEVAGEHERLFRGERLGYRLGQYRVDECGVHVEVPPVGAFQQDDVEMIQQPSSIDIGLDEIDAQVLAEPSRDHPVLARPAAGALEVETDAPDVVEVTGDESQDARAVEPAGAADHGRGPGVRGGDGGQVVVQRPADLRGRFVDKARGLVGRSRHGDLLVTYTRRSDVDHRPAGDGLDVVERQPLRAKQMGPGGEHDRLRRLPGPEDLVEPQRIACDAPVRSAPPHGRQCAHHVGRRGCARLERTVRHQLVVDPSERRVLPTDHANLHHAVTPLVVWTAGAYRRNTPSARSRTCSSPVTARRT